MLITVQVADFKLANHLKDPDAIYISSLELPSFSTKKGIAVDRFQFSLPREALDSIGESFTYLIYNTPVKLYLNDALALTGLVTKISTQANNKVSIEVMSMMSWHLKQMFSPSLEATCQNQTYSKHCSLEPNNFKFSFTNVKIDCMTGFATLEILADSITLGGSTSSVGGSNNDQFLSHETWAQATVMLNGKYKSQIVNVTQDRIYFAMNYLDDFVIADTVDIYLKCDRTYGVCYSRFSNTHNYWGFANTGRKVNTFDIFSASSLEYCGEDLVGGPLENCTTDNSFFGITL